MKRIQRKRTGVLQPTGVIFVGRPTRLKRIQRQRSKGWRTPTGARYVGRPTRWGNPYSLRTHSREHAMQLFRQHVADMPAEERAAWLAPLRDAKALMCWCAPDESCHADVLIEYLEKL